jgi:Tfp pilus assembly protein FimT
MLSKSSWSSRARASPILHLPVKCCLHIGHAIHLSTLSDISAISTRQLICARPDPGHAQPVESSRRCASPSQQTQHKEPTPTDLAMVLSETSAALSEASFPQPAVVTFSLRTTKQTPTMPNTSVKAAASSQDGDTLSMSDTIAVVCAKSGGGVRFMRIQDCPVDRTPGRPVVGPPKSVAPAHLPSPGNRQI